ncbi:MAG: hypothetical protein SFT90_05360 [Rickettsiales bacterium]|nr:hypothetical protein [Rickettsiales bacterium]
MKRNLAKIPSNLEQNFEVQYNAKLPEFSNEFCEAFECKHKNSKDLNEKLYALIFNKDFPVNIDTLILLKEIKASIVQELVDFGKIKNSLGKEVLAAIFKRPKGVTLRKFLYDRKEISDVIVTSNLLSQLILAINILHKNNLAHNAINLDNIYIETEGLNLTLKESTSQYSGFYQPAIYETYERISCHKAGKKPNDFSADYYALGVVLACLLLGEEVFEGMPDDIVAKIKFENGSYDSFIGILNSKKQVKISVKNETLLKALLHDKDLDRWGIDEINKWQKKEVSNLNISRVHRQSSNGYIFDDREFFSPKYLAYEIQKNWALAKKNLRIPDLSRWLSFTSKLPDVERKFFLMTSGWQSEVIIPDEKLSRIINLLDDDGPIRMRETCFHPIATGNIFAYFTAIGNKEGLEDIASIMDLGLLEAWISQQDNQEEYKPINLGWNPKKIKHYLRKKEVGFGFDRCVYEMNKYLACKSPLVANFYCTSLEEILMDIERAKLSANDNLDTNIMAFLAFQCEVEDTIKIKNLSQFSDIGNLDELRLCALFSLAQVISGLDSLPNLTRWLREKLSVFISKIKSNKIRDQFEESINKSVATGNIAKLFAVVTDAKLIKKDKAGFSNAKKKFKILNFQIFRLKSKANLDQISYKLGLKAALIFSYLISAVSVLTVMLLTVK